MKKELLTLVAGSAMFASFANAEIVLTDDLSAYGYIDMSLTDDEGDGNTSTSVAEFELGFAFTPADSAWSAVAELQFDGTGQEDDGDDAVEFETVTITYAYSDELSFTFGNILSYQGFETFDATGLYQYSYSGPLNTPLYSAGYAVGASVDYVTDAYAFGAWVGDTDDADQSYELLAAFTGVEGLTVKAIYAGDPNYETINVWAAYDFEGFTFAAEYIKTDYTTGYADAPAYSTLTASEIEAVMLLAYYAYGDAGLTVRYVTGDATATGGVSADYDKFTISPSYAFSDNVFGLLEFSSEELDGVYDQDTVAAELIFSF